MPFSVFPVLVGQREPLLQGCECRMRSPSLVSTVARCSQGLGRCRDPVRPKFCISLGPIRSLHDISSEVRRSKPQRLTSSFGGRREFESCIPPTWCQLHPPL